MINTFIIILAFTTPFTIYGTWKISKFLCKYVTNCLYVYEEEYT